MCAADVACLYGVRRLSAVSLFPGRNVVVSVRFVYVHKRLSFLSPHPSSSTVAATVAIVYSLSSSSSSSSTLAKSPDSPLATSHPPSHSVPPLPYYILTFAIPFTRYGATTPAQRPGNNKYIKILLLLLDVLLLLYLLGFDTVYVSPISLAAAFSRKW